MGRPVAAHPGAGPRVSARAAACRVLPCRPQLGRVQVGELRCRIAPSRPQSPRRRRRRAVRRHRRPHPRGRDRQRLRRPRRRALHGAARRLDPARRGAQQARIAGTGRRPRDRRYASPTSTISPPQRRSSSPAASAASPWSARSTTAPSAATPSWSRGCGDCSATPSTRPQPRSARLTSSADGAGLPQTPRAPPRASRPGRAARRYRLVRTHRPASPAATYTFFRARNLCLRVGSLRNERFGQTTQVLAEHERRLTLGSQVVLGSPQRRIRA